MHERVEHVSLIYSPLIVYAFVYTKSSIFNFRIFEGDSKGGVGGNFVGVHGGWPGGKGGQAACLPAPSSTASMASLPLAWLVVTLQASHLLGPISVRALRVARRWL